MTRRRCVFLFGIACVLLVQMLKAGPHSPSGERGSAPTLDPTGDNHAVTCNVTEATVGVEATLTCDFNTSINGSNIQVTFYNSSQSSGDYTKILDCYQRVIEQSTEYTCESYPGYQLQGSVTRYAKITFRSENSREGRYECLIPPAHRNPPGKCVFKLLASETGSVSSQSVKESETEHATPSAPVPLIVGVAAGVIVLILFVLVGVWVCRKRRAPNRRRQGTAPDRNGAQDNSSSPLQGTDPDRNGAQDNSSSPLQGNGPPEVNAEHRHPNVKTVGRRSDHAVDNNQTPKRPQHPATGGSNGTTDTLQSPATHGHIQTRTNEAHSEQLPNNETRNNLTEKLTELADSEKVAGHEMQTGHANCGKRADHEKKAELADFEKRVDSETEADLESVKKALLNKQEESLKERHVMMQVL